MKDNVNVTKQDSGLPSRPLNCSACVDVFETFSWLLEKAVNKTIQPHEMAVLYLIAIGSIK
jgi:hypothetical protein